MNTLVGDLAGTIPNRWSGCGSPSGYIFDPRRNCRRFPVHDNSTMPAFPLSFAASSRIRR